MKDPVKLKELVQEKVDLGDVLQDYGAHFVYNPSKAEEVQLRCPFHGDDRKPSARYYKDSQSMFCWVCHKRWDLFEFIMDKEQTHFIHALKILVNKYKLDTSSIPDDPEFVQEKVKKSSQEDFDNALFGGEDILVDLTGQKSELSMMSKKIREHRGELPFDKYRALNGAIGMVRYAISQGLDSSLSVSKLRNKLQSI